MSMNYLISLDIFTKEESMEMMINQPYSLSNPFQIVYEDENLIVLDKPFDMDECTKRESKRFPEEYTCEDLKENNIPPLDKIRFAHNLELATSGILVTGKNKKITGLCNHVWPERLARY